jgi:hypothetical protein
MAECYECGNTVDQLSKRSRCVDCECERSIFNEAENERLRQRVETLEAQLRMLRLTTGWKPCPVCGEPDMPYSDDLDGGGFYMTCLNLNCASNGGTNKATLAPQEGE